MAASIEVRMSKAYTANGGRNAGALPWAAIIQLIMQLFGGCTTPAAAKRWMRRHPEATQDAIDAKLKEGGHFTATKDRAAAVSAAYTAFLATSDRDIEAAL